MPDIKKILSIVFIFCCLAIFFAECWAGEAVPPPEPSIYLPLKKLSRGVVNLVTAPLEVPNQMYWQAKRGKDNTGRVIVGYVEGIFIGTGWTVVRFLAGTYDLITFPLPPYKKSLIQPEYVFDWYQEEDRELYGW
jgi:putative exosortase-associated protein (TIGR04073 family)